MSEILEGQIRFTEMIGRLIQHAYSNGFALTFGCARCAKEGHHMVNSLHYDGLAVDFNLFRRGPDGKWVYCPRTDDHRMLGEYWELMGGAWGGRFKTNSDGNHYSLEFGGRK